MGQGTVKTPCHNGTWDIICCNTIIRTTTTPHIEARYFETDGQTYYIMLHTGYSVPEKTLLMENTPHFGESIFLDIMESWNQSI
jgi:hypothetical protein